MEFIIRQKYTKNNGIHPKPNSREANFICVDLCVQNSSNILLLTKQQNNLKTTLARKHIVERKNRKRRVHTLIQRMRVVSYLLSLMRWQSMSLTFLFYSTKWNDFIKCICLLSWSICHSGTTYGHVSNWCHFLIYESSGVWVFSKKNRILVLGFVSIFHRIY